MEQEEFHRRCGEILRKTLNVECHLESIISDYFCYPWHYNGHLFRESIMSKVGFERKIEILQDICKNEGVKFKPELRKVIRFVKNVRNQVAHIEANAVDNGLGIELRQFRKGKEKKLEITEELMHEFEENQSFTYNGLSELHLELFNQYGKRVNELLQ